MDSPAAYALDCYEKCVEIMHEYVNMKIGFLLVSQEFVCFHPTTHPLAYLPLTPNPQQTESCEDSNICVNRAPPVQVR